MRPLRHGYTNRTLGDGATVVKCYRGPGALARSRLEQAMLHALPGQVPVPQILDYSDGCLTMTFMNGIHGQDLLDAGRADGCALRDLANPPARQGGIAPHRRR